MAEPEAYRAEYLAQSPAPRLWPGQTAVAWIRRRNVGRATWRRDGQPPVLLGTEDRRDRTSPLFDEATRVAPNRVAGVPGPVLPGHAVDIAAALGAPSQTGRYEERFRLVAGEIDRFGPPVTLVVAVP